MVLGSCPSPKDLQVIVKTCKEVAVYALIEKHVEETFQVLGKHLRGVEIRHDFPMSDMFASTATDCDNVEVDTLGLGKRFPEFLTAFFKNPKPLIRNLKLTRYVGASIVLSCLRCWLVVCGIWRRFHA